MTRVAASAALLAIGALIWFLITHGVFGLEPGAAAAGPLHITPTYVSHPSSWAA